MRLFVAIELEEPIKRAIVRAQRSLSRFDSMVRWVAPEQMHLTLKFLGEVPDARLPDICAALELAVQDCDLFELTTAAPGCFPPRGQARVIWLGTDVLGNGLSACQSAIEDALEAAGFPREQRPFSAHLTLGRVRGDRSGGALRRDVSTLNCPAVAQRVESVALMQSQLSPKGARYTRLGVWPLAGVRAGRE